MQPGAPPQEADAGSDHGDAGLSEGDAGSSVGDAGSSDGDAGAPSPDSGLGYTPLGLGAPWPFTDSAEADDFATTENATKTWEESGQLRHLR